MQVISTIIFALIYNCIKLINAKWFFDAEKSTGLNTIGNEILNNNENDWERENAIWSEGISVNEHKFWQFKIHDIGSGSIGLTSKEFFSHGWDLKGLLYAEGLSDGIEILEPTFGPPLQQNDFFGIYVNYTIDFIDVYFYLNNHSLGQAYHIPNQNVTKLFPVVSFEGPGHVEFIYESKEFPDNNINDEDDSNIKNINYSITGNWKLDITSLYCEDPEDRKLVPDLSDIISDDKLEVNLQISLSSENSHRIEYGAVLDVVNTMQFPLAHDLDRNIWVTPGMRISTNQIGTEAQLDFERWLNAYSFNPQSISVINPNSDIALLEVVNDGCVVYFSKVKADPINESPFIQYFDEE